MTRLLPSALGILAAWTLAPGTWAAPEAFPRPVPAAPVLRPDDGSAALRRTLELIATGGVATDGIRADLPAARPLPKAIGDRLTVSLDDGVAPLGGDWEARLDVSGGVAGLSDAVAIRFPASSLAVAPPFDVSALILGLDDVHGAATWPVELWLEDATTPLQPRQGAVSSSGVIDAVAAGLAPASGTRPTDFRRIREPMTLSVPASWLSDGAYDDAFERAAVPLADQDWVECEDGSCGTLNVFLAGGRAVRQTGGGALLAVRFPAAAAETMRPHRDLDLKASVRIADGSASFRRAGLALRVIAPDAFYRVEYQKSPSQVVVTAVLPAPVGAVAVGAPLPVPSPSSGTRLLEVVVSGSSPSVRFDVSVDGTSVGTVTDTTWRLTGWHAGLSASDPAGSAEAWDDFRIERRPDVFAVIAFPPGEDVGLPLDVSDSSLASQAILLSADGVTFTPPPQVTGCANPGNPFVQLEVGDVVGDRLFQREAHVVSVELSCPTCREGLPACPRNVGVGERPVPTLTPFEQATLRVRWWNEHLANDTLMFRGTLWTGPCDAVIAQVASGTATGIGSTGQGSAGLSEASVFSFAPDDPGPHCIVIEELHDVNGDCCPDGEEAAPLGGCAGACTPVAPNDSNGGTRYTLVDVMVSAPCALPLGEDAGRDGPTDIDGDRIPDEINLDGSSLRIARATGEAVTLSWGRHDTLVFPAIYNVHVAREATFSRADCYPEQAPVLQRIVGATSVEIEMPVRPGNAAWISVAETDGCDGSVSVPDDSIDDPGLACP